MRLAKILSAAIVPMFLLACGDDNPSINVNSPNGENPQDSSKVEPPPNIPDSALTPITRDYSKIWTAGEGTAENPYQIANEQDLRNLAFYVNDSSMNFKDKFFKQTADIALSSAWSPIGVYGKNSLGYGNRPFSGTYDGGSKTISGLSISDTTAYSGLFGLIRGAHVSNLVIKGAKMNVGSYAGVLAGMMDSSVVENCTIDGAEVKGKDRVAGLTGEATYVTVTNVAISGSVSGENSVAGIIGRMQNGTLTTLSNKAAVTGKSTVGGIVGASASVGGESVITSVLNYGTVTGTKDVGGLAATMSMTKMERSGNYGEVTASESQLGSAGGVVGVASSKSSLNEVFNTAKVSGTKVMAVGGVIGSMKTITATNVFNHGEIAGDASTFKGGLIGIIDGESKLEFSYNKGKIPDDNNSGTVAGKASMTAALANVYYDKTVGGTCLDIASHMLGQDMLPTGLPTENMITATFATTLTGAGGSWKSEPTKFDGYPAFAWIQ
ncbi:MAG: hypothetical protein II565_01930 [Fibrobacter sp.]|nr:hypothetical protein [Fibrobacter sp.]MBQ5465392.1 hypothetical protein [Fibrobacter sp.]